MPREIHEFLERYRDAFNRLDGDAIAAHYAEPSGIAQAGAYTHWSTLAPVRANMRALCDAYRQRGYASAAFEPKAFLPQGDRFAIVDLQWRIDWTGASDPWHFRTTYNLVRTAEGWRVMLCTAYEEESLHRAEGHDPS